jgi:cellobiose phosphorylase
MINVWNAYNCLLTFTWSRAASLIYGGDRDGMAYRDTVQDFVGVTPTIPAMVGERLELMLTGQNSTGGAMPLVRPFAHEPGKMPPTPEHSYRSDDCLWLFNAVPAYVAEVGDLTFYDKVLPYSDQGSATVLGHLRRALEFNLERTGQHGLPSGLDADWNDCLRLGPKGESLFVTFQVRFGLVVYADIAQRLARHSADAAHQGSADATRQGSGGVPLPNRAIAPVDRGRDAPAPFPPPFDPTTSTSSCADLRAHYDGEAAWAAAQLQGLDRRIQAHAWDGEWFVRGYRENGVPLGSKSEPEGTIFINAQSWAVISGAATPDQAERAMASAHERLATEYGLMICAPPYAKTPYHIVRAVLMNGGMKENGGIFSQPQGWAVIAETLLGHGDRAYEYYRAFMPAAQNDKAEIRQIEPYVHCQSTHSPFSRRYGASRIPWLTGTAAWAYFSATQHILGLRPEMEGLRLDPCVPASWKEFTMTRLFRGKQIHIRVENPAGVQKGVVKTILNGEALKDNLLPAESLKEANDVVVTMG